MLRGRLGCYLVADCATAAEVAQHIDLATLVPGQRKGHPVADPEVSSRRF